MSGRIWGAPLPARRRPCPHAAAPASILLSPRALHIRSMRASSPLLTPRTRCSVPMPWHTCRIWQDAEMRVVPGDELLLRHLLAGWKGTYRKFDPIPNRKTDTNNHGVWYDVQVCMCPARAAHCVACCMPAGPILGLQRV